VVAEACIEEFTIDVFEPVSDNTQEVALSPICRNRE
jgi:hypothetical protein